jgi:hypothetical protein
VARLNLYRDRYEIVLLPEERGKQVAIGGGAFKTINVLI